MKRAVTVLQDDIDSSVRGDPFGCAVARAAARDLADLLAGDFSFFTVCGGTLNLYTWDSFLAGRSRTRFPLPEEALALYAAFDRGEPVEPLKFEVEVPEPFKFEVDLT